MLLVEQPRNGGRHTNYRAGISSATREGPLCRLSPDLSQVQVLGHRIDKVKTVYALTRRRDEAIQPYCSLDSAAVWLSAESNCLEHVKTIIADEEVAVQTHVRNLTMNLWEIPHTGRLRPISTDRWPEVLQAYQDTVSHYGEAVRTRSFSRKSAEEVSCFKHGYAMNGSNRPYFFTEHDRVGRGTPDVQAGDPVVVLYSYPAPFILRYGEDSKVAELIGDAYLDGCMDADTMPPDGKGPEEWFTIG
jgi:hypothetical protein